MMKIDNTAFTCSFRVLAVMLLWATHAILSGLSLYLFMAPSKESEWLMSLILRKLENSVAIALIVAGMLNVTADIHDELNQMLHRRGLKVSINLQRPAKHAKAQGDAKTSGERESEDDPHIEHESPRLLRKKKKTNSKRATKRSRIPLV